MSDSAMTTYKRADGSLIGDGDFSFVTELEWFEYDDEPVELVEEVWERKFFRTFWKLPDRLSDCDVLDCDNDATAWVMVEGAPEQRCPGHTITTFVAGQRWLDDLSHSRGSSSSARVITAKGASDGG